MNELNNVQALQGERSMTIVLPKSIAESLHIARGDFLKVSIEGNRLVLQKVDKNWKFRHFQALEK